MIDSITQRPLQVSAESPDWPYLVVPFAQLDKVTGVLDANRIEYWVDDEVLSMDGGPEIAFVNLQSGTDPATVQQLIDALP